MRRLRGVLLAALVAAPACHSKGSTVLLVTVSLWGSAAPVGKLDVTAISTSTAGTDDKVYGDGTTAIAFPTTFTAELPASITGVLTLDIKAIGTDGQPVAHGRAGPLTLLVGTRQPVAVRLDCGGAACSLPGSDGGATATLDGGPDASPACGNGVIDVDELCDTAIPAGAPGACPPASCDDGIPCTTDVRVGDGCRVSCAHPEITTRKAADGCCPAGATSADDPDCSPTCGNGTVDEGEACDTAIPDGDPGACPTEVGCDDGDPCTKDRLIGKGTCGAICAHDPVTVQSGTEHDGCCPAGAWHAVDVDCPAACGDGQLDVPDELCDPGLPSTDPRACPTACDDGDPCTLDVLQGSACQAHCVSTPITALVSGDGCCPAGASQRTDPDCAAVCGNGVLEVGESCDKGVPAASVDACPRACPRSPSACLKSVLAGDAASCTARCELELVTTCSAARDGCCAAGCTAANDADCSPTCGDGAVELGYNETCDVAIAAGKPGACPTACNDGLVCTRDVLVAAGTCHAACLYLPITDFRPGDGCCPPNADANLDPDCAPLCGNSVVEPPGETCDYNAGTAACPTACSGGDQCTAVTLEGSKGSCNARCVVNPVTACVSGDGCCPGWCTIARDADCPIVCGDGVLSSGEACDRGITTGLPGACPRTCDDGDACTTDWASGTIEGCSRACSHARITACRGGDGCCPPGCDGKADSDCAPTCGDGQIGAGETCDPPSTCPAVCPDDGDPCTREVLVGAASLCTAACAHVPVTTCSGAAPDFCCPTSCTAATDVDCPAVGPGQ
jgi:hypothetical protein